MTAPTEPDLEAIERRCEAACKPEEQADGSRIYELRWDLVRQDIPALLSHIKTQQSEIERLKEVGENAERFRASQYALEEQVLSLTRRAEAAEAERDRLREEYRRVRREVLEAADEVGAPERFGLALQQAQETQQQIAEDSRVDPDSLHRPCDAPLRRKDQAS